MLAVPEDQKPRRTDRRPCPHCGGSADGCRALEWLRAGSRCCEACAGNHDQDQETR